MGLRIRVSRKWLLLILGVVVIRLASISPVFVEKYYASGLYPASSALQRILTGWCPFSLGDLLYIFAGIWLIRQLVLGIVYLKSNGRSRPETTKRLSGFLAVLVAIYIIFNGLWGLNYNRQTPALKMGLQVSDSAGVSELAAITGILLEKTNRYRPATMISYDQSRSIATDLFKGPEPAAVVPPSIKTSLFGKLGNYMGYSGYYNPISGEAQVNNAIPSFLIPYVVCHEMAHQAGYAKENEANFVGYLAAKRSADSAMRYSTYFSMFLYANGQLRRLDSAAAKSNMEKLSPGAKKDVLEYRIFLKRYDSPLGTFVDAFYNQYLRMNQQPEGSQTYNRVVLWLLAYYRKYGEL